MISEDKINLNFVRWIDYLQKYDCYSEAMINDIGEKIKLAPFNMSEKMGGAYVGGLIDVTLNHLCKIAFNVNENGISSSQLKVNTHLLIKVCLLQHISKALMFVYNDNEWKRKNGQPFEFDKDIPTKLKIGEKSLYLCQKYGITLSEEEFEAILIIDKEQDKITQYNSTLAIITNFANQLTNKQLLILQNS